MSGRIAILGAGIMGASLALFLARRGRDVALFDRQDAPLACASRWNEGKIHLGYLYGADPSLATARHVIPGGLAFRRLVSELVGRDIAGAATREDDVYLVHRDSVADPDTLDARFAAVAALARAEPEAAGYLADLSTAGPRRLSAGELAAIAEPRAIVAAFATPERSVDTRQVADALVAALAAEPRIALRTATTIAAVRPDGGDGWRVAGSPDLDERFDVVVNALWEGRLAVDRGTGLAPEPGWSHRYRLALFVRTDREVPVPSALVAVGPFGDVKNYDGRTFYLSWYPAGLVAEGEAVTPPEPPPLDAEGERRLVAAVRENLGRLIPPTRAIFDAAREIEVRGGFVFAQGRGSLGDPGASLHRRDRFGIRRTGSYFSVDTGKYSTAPWLAARLAREICGA